MWLEWNWKIQTREDLCSLSKKKKEKKKFFVIFKVIPKFIYSPSITTLSSILFRLRWIQSLSHEHSGGNTSYVCREHAHIIHTLIHSHTQWQFRVSNPATEMFLRVGKTLENLEKPLRHRKNMNTQAQDQTGNAGNPKVALLQLLLKRNSLLSGHRSNFIHRKKG